MTEKQQRFQELHPDTFYLTADQPQRLIDFLQENDWIKADETVNLIEKPGEGNMNYVLRVRTDRQSFIVKQSRPWVEKYSQLDAPIERITVEAKFYSLVSDESGLKAFVPELKNYKADEFIMAVQDLGAASDFTDIYKKGKPISGTEINDLVTFISELHRLPTKGIRNTFPDNQALKLLNAEHIFDYPYLEENGFDLDTIQPGLQELAMTYKRDKALKNKVKSLSEVYLGQGDTLLHGDYYPGSWLRTDSGTKVIDPEFAYLGRAEFDLGVLVAHLKMAQTDDEIISEALAKYETPDRTFDHDLFAGFCGAEILRRIIGLAQLPLDLTLKEKGDLLAWAAAAVKNPETNFFLKP